MHEKTIQQMLVSGDLAKYELIERSAKELGKGRKKLIKWFQNMRIKEAGAARLRIAKCNRWEQSQASLGSNKATTRLKKSLNYGHEVTNVD
ncbi:hypothetical protein K3495_g4511 [Podosphaera aphanis]|nr:hypothetical protein K3495_g4511 [Podosphaera aphanis]